MANIKGKVSTTSALDGEQTRVSNQDGQLSGVVRDDAGRLVYWARRPMGYGDGELDRGQVFSLSGLVNDRKLDKLGYIVALRPTDEVFPCRHCAAKFVGLGELNGHGAKRHSDKDKRADVPFSPRGTTVDETAAQTQAFEKEQRQADQVAPLNYDKTEASRGARA